MCNQEIRDNSGDRILLLMCKKIKSWFVSFPELLVSKMRSTSFKCYLPEVEECCKVTKYLVQTFFASCYCIICILILLYLTCVKVVC